MNRYVISVEGGSGILSEEMEKFITEALHNYEYYDSRFSFKEIKVITL